MTTANLLSSYIHSSHGLKYPGGTKISGRKLIEERKKFMRLNPDLFGEKGLEFINDMKNFLIASDKRRYKMLKAGEKIFVPNWTAYLRGPAAGMGFKIKNMDPFWVLSGRKYRVVELYGLMLKEGITYKMKTFYDQSSFYSPKTLVIHVTSAEDKKYFKEFFYHHMCRCFFDSADVRLAKDGHIKSITPGLTNYKTNFLTSALT